jgi:hypothetical protein
MQRLYLLKAVIANYNCFYVCKKFEVNTVSQPVSML